MILLCKIKSYNEHSKKRVHKKIIKYLHTLLVRSSHLIMKNSQTQSHLAIHWRLFLCNEVAKRRFSVKETLNFIMTSCLTGFDGLDRKITNHKMVGMWRGHLINLTYKIGGLRGFKRTREMLLLLEFVTSLKSSDLCQKKHSAFSFRCLYRVMKIRRKTIASIH